MDYIKHCVNNLQDLDYSQYDCIVLACIVKQFLNAMPTKLLLDGVSAMEWVDLRRMINELYPNTQNMMRKKIN